MQSLFALKHEFDIVLVQWLERLSQRRMEQRDIRHQLSSFHPVSYPVHWSQVFLPHATGQTARYGFRD